MKYLISLILFLSFHANAEFVEGEFLRIKTETKTWQEYAAWISAPWAEECVWDEQGNKLNDRGIVGCVDMTGGALLGQDVAEALIKAHGIPEDVHFVAVDRVSKAYAICHSLTNFKARACYHSGLKTAYYVYGDKAAAIHEAAHAIKIDYHE